MFSQTTPSTCWWVELILQVWNYECLFQSCWYCVVCVFPTHSWGCSEEMGCSTFQCYEWWCYWWWYSIHNGWLPTYPECTHQLMIKGSMADHSKASWASPDWQTRWELSSAGDKWKTCLWFIIFINEHTWHQCCVSKCEWYSTYALLY